MSIKSTMDEEGVVVLEGFLSPGEADELRHGGEELEKNRPENEISTTPSIGNPMQNDSYFLSSNDKIRYFIEESVDKQSPARINKIGHALHWLHPLFRFYTFSNRVKQVCNALRMDDPTVVQSVLVYRRSGCAGDVAPRQDGTYLSTEPDSTVGFWIALEDATLENGCLWVAKGSHKSGLHIKLKKDVDQLSNSLFGYDRPLPLYPASNFTALPVSKGDCILLHGSLVYKSGPNKSVYNQSVYSFHVVEKGAKYSEDNWLQEGPDAPFVSLYTTGQHAD